ncbi:hypothetical protein [Macrococcoides caseolyticum]|uniref:hypothetical protein n=1 Tax=Macrococcoides caseolyticum TaxID=69966 RepID=UPI001F21E5D7|nr:hypothetical protein [Macrococcus caseolyticus]MCE4956274.1 hypothetical protein [Macrococcus caseolyticus]
MTEASSGIEWGTLFFTFFSLSMMIVIVTLVIYFSRRLKEIKGLEKRVRDLEQCERNRDQI